MKCSKCYSKILPNSEFCTNCGKGVLKDQQKERLFLKNLKFFFIKIFRFLFTKKIMVGLLIFAVLTFLFYWFAYLPRIEEQEYKEAKSACHYETKARYFSKTSYEYNYKMCLRSKGLE